MSQTKNYDEVTLRGFKIIKFVINQKGICDFLLVVNSNLGRILYGFRATVTYSSKIAPRTYPVSFNVLARGQPLANMLMNLIPPKTVYTVLPSSIDSIISSLFSFRHNTGVCQTDTQTDGRTNRRKCTLHEIILAQSRQLNVMTLTD